MNEIRIKTADWADTAFSDLWWRYLCLYGGRGGGKTTEVAQFFALEASQRKIIVACVRQFQNSIEESVKPAIEAKIHECGLTGMFRITDKYIDCPMTGSHFFFKGIDRNIYSIKGWEDVDFCWIEEANTTKKASWELLRPTIRKPNSKIIVTFNRHSRADPVDEFFLGGHPPKDALIMKVGWQDNPFFTAELNSERLHCLENEPDRYPHIWEGEPDDSPDGKVIIPYAWLQECVDAHIKLGVNVFGVSHAGLDAADGGNDPWGYVLRTGPLINEAWYQKGEAGTVVPIAHRYNTQSNVTRMYFDASGVGAAVKSEMNHIKHTYKVEKFLFGGQVQGKENHVIKGVKNKDYFSRLNSQGWWNLRQRAINTRKLLRGESVDTSKCLFIDSKIDNLDQLLLELSQAVYDYDTSNRIVIKKAPEDKQSPNMADATVMAFAFDVRRGIRKL